MDFDYVVMPAIIFVIGILIVWLSMRRILSLSKKSYRMWRKVAERIVLSVVVLLAAFVAGSSAYNAIAIYHFWAANQPPGDFYSVNGHRMHIICTGSGSPTIVLESGLGNDALIWGGVQPILSKTTRVCSYDRAGFGWSDALPAPRDADHIAAELHGLLLQAKVTGPIVLMGHSIAGIYIRDYATRYPENLVGLVFVDGSTPLQDENPVMKAAASKVPPLWALELLIKSAFSTGIPRLMGQCSKPINGFDAHAGKLQMEDVCQAHVSPIFDEMDSVNRSGHETAHSGPYGSLPILIFSRDTNGLAASTPEDSQDPWNQMQEDLKKLSTRSRRIIAKGSTHYIHIDRAELIEKEVPLFIEQIRGTAPQPTNYGSTITE
ncbi:MAG TPA: alpha/beta hydrolase [Terracidiphilus sp.]|jgi:pimeloyl-ACP methyl ester carboxylesterase